MVSGQQLEFTIPPLSAILTLAWDLEQWFESPCTSLSKHMGDGKVKLGRGPYAISTAILSMYEGFQHPGTKYMLAAGHRKLTFFVDFLVVLQNCQFEQFATILTWP